MAHVRHDTAPNTGYPNIAGRRVQILTHIFPSVVKDHLTVNDATTVKPHELFDAVVREFAFLGFFAFLTYGEVGARRSAAQGSPAVTVESALASLLELMLQPTTNLPPKSILVPEESQKGLRTV